MDHKIVLSLVLLVIVRDIVAGWRERELAGGLRGVSGEAGTQRLVIVRSPAPHRSHPSEGLSSLSAIDVNFTGDWKEGTGWELVCSWSLPERDRLQSVRLSRDRAQFQIYRPETQGSNLEPQQPFKTPDSLMLLHCHQYERHRGQCSITLQPVQPPIEQTLYTCEVSGERPMFLMKEKDFLLEPYVPSHDAHLEASIKLEQTPDRVQLNCTATGIPAPELSWTIGHQKVPADFSIRKWNATTKLWHVWSSIALTPKADQAMPVLCTPEQKSFRNDLVLGPPAEFMLQQFRRNGVAGLSDDFRFASILLILSLLMR